VTALTARIDWGNKAMMTLISCNIIPLLIAALIGLLTGWWIWANRVRVSLAADAAVPAPTLARSPIPVVPPAPAPEPVRAPEPVKLAEPVVAASPPPAAVAAAPVPVAAAMTAIGIPAAVGRADDLLQVKGIGPKLNALLISLGITRFDQIAAWGTKEIGIVDGHLGAFKGRIGRDEWVHQAGLLASGNVAAFEAKYGKLDSENK
jgi:predicted flap endonuclease-1-like 5' DNA nuclease